VILIGTLGPNTSLIPWLIAESNLHKDIAIGHGQTRTLQEKNTFPMQKESGNILAFFGFSALFFENFRLEWALLHKWAEGIHLVYPA
jgi:hypothetical protein